MFNTSASQVTAKRTGVANRVGCSGSCTRIGWGHHRDSIATRTGHLECLGVGCDVLGVLVPVGRSIACKTLLLRSDTTRCYRVGSSKTELRCKQAFEHLINMDTDTDIAIGGRKHIGISLVLVICPYVQSC
jgi:hypothetical protein